MNKFLALVLLLTLITLTTLGNFWFTYGIWPRSWISFFGFFIIGVILYGLMDIARKSEN